MNKSDLIALRVANKGDHNFIFSTMLRSLFYGETWFSLIPKHVFMTNYHGVIERIIFDPKNTLVVACLKDEPDVLLGYSIVGPDAIHFVYVKRSWRSIGLAKSLVPADIKIVTHVTISGLAIVRKKNWVFNPFKI